MSVSAAELGPGFRAIRTAYTLLQFGTSTFVDRNLHSTVVNLWPLKYLV